MREVDHDVPGHACLHVRRPGAVTRVVNEELDGALRSIHESLLGEQIVNEQDLRILCKLEHGRQAVEEAFIIFTAFGVVGALVRGEELKNW